MLIIRTPILRTAALPLCTCLSGPGPPSPASVRSKIIIIINNFYRAQITIKSLSALIEGKIKNRQTEKQKEEKK